MTLSQIIEALPPRVYIRSGELVIQFSTPADLANRITETQAAFATVERLEPARPDTRIRGKAAGRPSASAHGESTGATEVENNPYSPTRPADGKED